MLLLFPDGHLPRPWWLRLPSLATLGALAALPLVLALVPSAVAERFYDEPLPAAVQDLELDPVSVALPYDVWAVLLTAGLVLSMASLAVPVLVVLGRFWRADAERRAQLTWLLLAAAVALGVMLSHRVVPPLVAELALALALVSGAVVVAVTRYRLYDLDLLVGWSAGLRAGSPRSWCWST